MTAVTPDLMDLFSATSTIHRGLQQPEGIALVISHYLRRSERRNSLWKTRFSDALSPMFH